MAGQLSSGELRGPDDSKPAGAARDLAALLVLCALEGWLFERHAARSLAWVFPRWMDQVQYLGESYPEWERGVDHGWAQGLAKALSAVSPQGWLAGVLSQFDFLVWGPTRLGELSLNFRYFLGLQIATFLAARSASISRPQPRREDWISSLSPTQPKIDCSIGYRLIQRIGRRGRAILRPPFPFPVATT